MQRLYKRIQSPAALFAFEAAAKHLSFTKAAAELNVSQPAISHAVKRIERALGIALFHRRHRSIRLTEAGEKFYADVSFGLMHILQSAEHVAMRGRSQHVTLSASTAFVHYWIVSRLASFKKKNPDIDLRLQTTDKDIDLTDEATSLGIRQGLGDWDGYDSYFLAREQILPVCSPGFLASVGPIDSVERLASHNLIHLEEPFRPGPTWSDWFAQMGVPFRDSGQGLRLDDYALVIQAAMAGEGIAMGWRHITDRLVAQNLLVNALDQVYDVGTGFYVIHSKSSRLSPKAEIVLAWLLSQVSGVSAFETEIRKA